MKINDAYVKFLKANKLRNTKRAQAAFRFMSMLLEEAEAAVSPCREDAIRAMINNLFLDKSPSRRKAILRKLDKVPAPILQEMALRFIESALFGILVRIDGGLNESELTGGIRLQVSPNPDIGAEPVGISGYSEFLHETFRTLRSRR